MNEREMKALVAKLGNKEIDQLIEISKKEKENRYEIEFKGLRNKVNETLEHMNGYIGCKIDITKNRSETRTNVKLRFSWCK